MTSGPPASASMVWLGQMASLEPSAPTTVRYAAGASSTRSKPSRQAMGALGRRDRDLLGGAQEVGMRRVDVDRGGGPGHRPAVRRVEHDRRFLQLVGGARRDGCSLV